MIDSIAARIPRRALFLALNAAAALVIILFVIVPLAAGFSERSDRIAEAKEQLGRILALQRSNGPSPQQNEVLLQGSDEGAVSAALQADLKSTVAAAGARFLAVRSLEPVRLGDGKLVSVGLELEGSIYALREIFRGLENHVPALLIKSASLHAVSAEQDAAIHADIVVQGLMRNAAAEPATGTPVALDTEAGRGR